ncbi:MAG: FAD-dependent oxidoreductase, partial [Candidatus Hydrogenedentes bacterium]|nr:FAD-dependent oxidoreductase [Candidatus Hydrogenedentota bacterium]
LLYFLQNDPEVPEADRALARTYGLPKDEFTDTGNFPWCLYVREARRIVGEYTLSERDLMLAPESGRAPVHEDAISAGEFPIDSFPTRRYEPGHEDALEGYILMLDKLTQPYQIPYRVMIPKDIDGLIVPVACSATHIAFSSVRLEPTWMSLGQAAGIAAHVSIKRGQSLRSIDVSAIQSMLIEHGQVLSYFEDLPKAHPAFKVCQQLSVKGFFSDYNARTSDPFTIDDANRIVAASFPLRNFVGFGNRSSSSFVGEVEWKTICDNLTNNSPIPDGVLTKERTTVEDAVTRGDAFAILGQAQKAKS